MEMAINVINVGLVTVFFFILYNAQIMVLNVLCGIFLENTQ